MDPAPEDFDRPTDDGAPAPNAFTCPVSGAIRAVAPLGTDPSASDLLAALGRLARDTRRALRIALTHRGERLPATIQLYLEGTLNHLSHVREGFVLALRTDDCRDGVEMEDLVEEILIDWSFMTRLGIRWIPGEALEQPLTQVLAYSHARVVLGALPRVPEDQVTFPAWNRSYADIPVPRSPGDILTRIDEIERVVAATLAGAGGARGPADPVQRLGRDRLRRTYGFFETSAWLAGHVWH